MIAFPRCTTVRPLRGHRNFLFLGIADDSFDGLEDWMFGAGELPAAAADRGPPVRGRLQGSAHQGAMG
jgi:hypothetical protein